VSRSTAKVTFSSVRECCPKNSESFLSYLCVTADNEEDNEWRKCPNNLQKDTQIYQMNCCTYKVGFMKLDDLPLSGDERSCCAGRVRTEGQHYRLLERSSDSPSPRPPPPNTNTHTHTHVFMFYGDFPQTYSFFLYCTNCILPPYTNPTTKHTQNTKLSEFLHFQKKLMIYKLFSSWGPKMAPQGLAIFVQCRVSQATHTHTQCLFRYVEDIA